MGDEQVEVWAMKSLAKILVIGVPAGLVVVALPWNYGLIFVVGVLYVCFKNL